MKLKFINLLLAAFLLIGSAQVLTSCKDTDEDLYAQLRDDNLSLQKKFEADLNVLKAQISALETLTGSLQTQITNLETKLGDYAKKSDLDDYVKKTEFNNMVDQYISAVSTYNNLTEVLNALKKTQDEVTDAHGDFESIGARFINIESRLAQLESTLANYSTLVSDVETLKNFMQTATTDITNINNEITNINNSLTTLNSFMNEWSPKLGTIEQNATDALALAQKNEGDIAALTTTYQQLQQMVIDNKTATDAAIAVLQGKVDDLEGKLNTILEDYMTSDAVDTAIADAIAGLATQDALEAVAAALRKEAQDNLDEVELRLQQQIITIINRLNGLETKVGDIEVSITNLENDLEDLSDDVDGLKKQVLKNKKAIAANTKKIKALEESLNSVIVRIFNLENRISSILIQGVESPVLGYLKTPFGIESNFFLNYMGETDHKVNFPNFYFDGVEYDGELVITDKDIEIIGANTEGALTFNSGDVLFYDTDGNLGTIYLTLNPSNIDLTGKTFTVVTSQDKDTEIELKNLRPSNVELTQGYSRTIPTSPNGFYQADVTVAVDKVPTLRVVVDNELKAAAKKVLKERSASSLMALGNAVYNQFNGFLPALGIKAAWEESDGAETPTMKKQSVYSNYGMAAAAFKPLSYGFLYGKSFRQFHLPDLSGILDDYKFNFTGEGFNISFGEITIDGVQVNFSLNINPQIGDIELGSVGTEVRISNWPTGVDPDTEKMVSVFNDIKLENGLQLDPDNINRILNADGSVAYEKAADGSAIKVIPVNIDLGESDLADNLKTAIEDALDSALSGLDGQINQQLQGVIDSLIGQIQGQVNDMMKNLQNQVNTSLTEILENLQNQVNGKIDMISSQLMNNALYSRLQAIVNKFNGVLADPNHYLQPTLLYSMKGASYGMLSQNKYLPSQFTGSGNAVMLTPTTYTGEIVTPAFKKFVAVTNVFKSDDYSVNAQAGDAKCKELAAAANGQDFMNEVVPGERRTIPFSFEGGQGYTYEIVYQALDYAGVTSTAKYYVSIKK